MRTPWKITTAAALVLAVVSVAAPPAVASASASADARTGTRAADASYRYWGHHGLTRRQMREDVPLMQTRDYGPVSFSVGLEGSQDRYSGFWDTRRGPHRILISYGYLSGYQTRFDAYVANDYQPVMISATGSGQSAMYSAIFEKKANGFFARHGVDTARLNEANGVARRDGYVPVSINTYGTASSPRFVAVWEKNTSRVIWSVTTSVPAAEYQRLFDAQVRAGYRPSAVAVGPDGRSYTTVWRKDRIGRWYAFHGMTAAQYQTRFKEMTARGLYPTWIDMENGVYAAVFTTR
ncbi:hypothetical protein [Sphaerimonospora mesophila]|uniref:hypothetical protein n=1 Tax=Sphaerimonospora mesophila TaxID=37483 RepID=UPI000A9E39A7